MTTPRTGARVGTTGGTRDTAIDRKMPQETSSRPSSEKDGVMRSSIFSAYVAELARLDRAEGTIKGYLADLNSFASWFEATNGEELSASRVTPTDVREYRQRLIIQGLKPATINRRLSAIRAWLVFAEATGEINGSPRIRGIRRSESDLAPKAPSRNEMNAITRAAERRSPQAALLVWLLRGTGCRISEAASARLSQITLSPRQGDWTVIGKGGRSRTVYLNASVRSALARHIATRPTTDHDGLFVTRDRKPMSHWGLRELWEAVCRDAGVTGAVAHSARHFAALEMLTQTNGDICAVQGALGHAHPSTTLIYTRATPARIAAAFEKLSEED